MATPTTLTACLTEIGAVYGKHPAWATEARPAFVKALATVPDADVRAAFDGWAEGDHPGPPKPYDIQTLIRASRRTTAVASPGCCRGCVNGMREVAIHRQGRKDVEVDVVAARCTCTAGTVHSGRTHIEVQSQARGALLVVLDPGPLDVVPRGWTAPTRATRSRPSSGFAPAFDGPVPPPREEPPSVVARRAQAHAEAERRGVYVPLDEASNIATNSTEGYY